MVAALEANSCWRDGHKSRAIELFDEYVREPSIDGGVMRYRTEQPLSDVV